MGCPDCVWISGVLDASCSGELVLVPLQVAHKWVLKEARCLERVRTGRVAGMRSRRGFSSSSRWNVLAWICACVWRPAVLYWTLQRFHERRASLTASLGFEMKGRLQKMKICPISRVKAGRPQGLFILVYLHDLGHKRCFVCFDTALLWEIFYLTGT